MKLTPEYEDNIENASNEICEMHQKRLEEDKKNEKEVSQKILTEFKNVLKVDEEITIFSVTYWSSQKENIKKHDKTEMKTIEKITKDLFHKLKDVYEPTFELRDVYLYGNGYKHNFNVYLKRLK